MSSLTRLQKIQLKTFGKVLAIAFLIPFLVLTISASKTQDVLEKTATVSAVVFNDPETIVIVETTQETTQTQPQVNQSRLLDGTCSDKDTIFLTFDDGPSNETPYLLDILNKYGVKATFFVTASGSDETILRAFNEGHQIALHTYSHNYSYIYSSLDNYFSDLSQIQARVEKITSTTTNLIRFPGGSSNTVSARYDGGARIMTQLVSEIQSRGFIYFDWNIVSGDAGDVFTTAAVVGNVTSALNHNGPYIVLQHDTKRFSIDAVPQIITYAKNNGYCFSTLSAATYKAHHRISN